MLDDKHLKTLQITSQEDVDYFRDLDEFANFYYPKQDIKDVYALITVKPDDVEYRYFCFRYLDDMRQFKLPELKQNLEKEAVMVEFRIFPHLEFIIRNAIKKLGDSWSFTVVCGNKNYDFLVEMVNKMGADIKLIKYDRDNIDHNSYSEMLSSKEFWNKLVGEKILIYQEDSCIFKHNIDDFLGWDYIGAPWPLTQDTNSQMVGNGGLSLRSKSVMLKVIDKVDISKTKYNKSTLDNIAKRKLKIPPEDVYFSKNIIDFNLGKVADWVTANKFSVETQFHKNPFGGHRFWMAIKNWKKFLYTKVLRRKKVRTVINNCRAKIYIKSYSIKSNLIIREDTTDMAIFKQIFIQKDYDFPINMNPKFIIDGGANVGYASLFFANKFPDAEIVAIEPEDSNFEVLQKNTSEYKQVKTIKAGIWHKKAKLKIVGTEWGKCGFMTKEVDTADTYDAKTITIDEILKQSKYDEIDILKLDVEGA
ncbi:FkbM family methyltransferase, partial [Patescibacteria group bacterium]|nr:FkbM family methyltransferase [Patescibacteria group bacterium]